MAAQEAALQLLPLRGHNSKWNVAAAPKKFIALKFHRESRSPVPQYGGAVAGVQSASSLLAAFVARGEGYHSAKIPISRNGTIRPHIYSGHLGSSKASSTCIVFYFVIVCQQLFE